MDDLIAPQPGVRKGLVAALMTPDGLTAVLGLVRGFINGVSLYAWNDVPAGVSV